MIKKKLYYNQYRDLRQRLFNPNNSSYARYQGIEFDFKNYEDFHQEIEHGVGPRPSLGHQLTRRDINKGFVHGNLCWKTRKELAKNYVHCYQIQYHNKVMNATDYCLLHGISYSKFIKSMRSRTDLSDSKKVTLDDGS